MNEIVTQLSIAALFLIGFYLLSRDTNKETNKKTKGNRIRMYTVIVSPMIKISRDYVRDVLKGDPNDPSYIMVYDLRSLDRARYCQLKEAHLIYRSWEIPLLDRIQQFFKDRKCPIKYSE